MGDTKAVPTNDSARAGVDHFLAMLAEIVEGTEQQLKAQWDRPDDDGRDGRDYAWVVDVLRAGLARSAESGDKHHEGFLRGLADLVCLGVDGCAPTFKDWDPLRDTEMSFAARLQSEERSHG